MYIPLTKKKTVGRKKKSRHPSHKIRSGSSFVLASPMKLRRSVRAQAMRMLMYPVVILWRLFACVVAFFFAVYGPVLRLISRPPSEPACANFPTAIPRSLALALPKKTLVLDLDETLVHSSTMQRHHPHCIIDVELESVRCTFFVHYRPHVDLFLQRVSEWYNVVIFTASLRPYGDPVIDALDGGRNIISARYFRESCRQEGPHFMKNLAALESDLGSILIIDNSPAAYMLQPENAVPIKTWTDDPYDEELLTLLPLLDSLRFVRDVRSVLGLRTRASPP
eukprot:m.182227 g.182227  ORF g.182227 m.182227 type:complete len:280 (+) comp21500_c0_seq2:2182-3021(+)